MAEVETKTTTVDHQSLSGEHPDVVLSRRLSKRISVDRDNNSHSKQYRHVFGHYGTLARSLVSLCTQTTDGKHVRLRHSQISPSNSGGGADSNATSRSHLEESAMEPNDLVGEETKISNPRIHRFYSNGHQPGTLGSTCTGTRSDGNHRTNGHGDNRRRNKNKNSNSKNSQSTSQRDSIDSNVEGHSRARVHSKVASARSSFPTGGQGAVQSGGTTRERVLSMVLPPIRRFLGGLGDGWNSFFYTETTELKWAALVRITYSIVVLVNLLLFSCDFEYFLRLLPTSLARQTIDPDTWTIFELFPEQEKDGEGGVLSWYWYSLYLFMFQTILLGLGIAPRFQASGVFFWHNQFQSQNNQLWNGEDNVMRLLAFFLIFFPPNDGYTIWNLLPKSSSSSSSLISKMKPMTTISWPMWPFRLMQLQMCLIYFSTAGLKATGDAWKNGDALYRVVQVDSLYGGYFNPDWIFGYTTPLRVLTYSTMMLELATIVLLWFRETRLPMLIAACGFHISVDATMNLNCFHWIMIVGWCSFLIQPPECQQLAGRPLIQAVREAWATIICDRWNYFFYARTNNMKAAAFVRISYSTVVLVNLTLLSLDLDYFVRVMPTPFGRRTVDPDSWTILTWLSNNGNGVEDDLKWQRICLTVWMIQTALLGLGVAPRFQAFGLFFWHNQFQAQNSLLWNGEDIIMRLLSFFLIFFPPNDGYTIWDVLMVRSSTAKQQKKKRKQKPSSPTTTTSSWPMWPFRLMQLQMCLIYFSSGGLKFSGPEWQKGIAMYRVVQEDSLYGGYFNPDWMFGYTVPLQILTYSTLVVESLSIPLLWYSERTRIPALMLVIVFHISIDATMTLNCFHWIMIVGWCSFFIQPMSERTKITSSASSFSHSQPQGVVHEKIE